MEKSHLFKDNINVKSNNDIMIQLPTNENIVYSNKAIKFNRFGISKEISVIITENYFLIFSKSKLKCKSKLIDILGVTKSLCTTIQGELVVHFKNERDRRIRSDFRDEIIDLLKLFYRNLTK